MRLDSRSSTPNLSKRLCALVLASAELAGAITAPKPVSQPVFDLKALGRVGMVGDFSGVSLYEYTGQAQAAPYSNDSQSLMMQLPNGLFTSLAVTDGSINAMCHYETSDGNSKGIVVGGNFTSLKGVEAKGVALYNPQDDKVTAMGDFGGKVLALYCDKATSSVYVGGEFSRGKSNNALVWEDGKGWKDLPFAGFSGPVKAITRSASDSILFGGKISALSNFSAPSVQHAQVLNLAAGKITAGQSFNDPASITCTNDTSKQWLLQDGQKGFWESVFPFAIKPTKLRLINANQGGRGTKTFRVLRLSPTYGILNMTYIDPATKEQKYCDAWCPLAQSTNAQDFTFVNDIPMTTVRIQIEDWYGPAGGLSSVQLYQDEIYSYAIPTLNEPDCAPSTTRSGSTVSGVWEETKRSGTDDFYSLTVTEAQRAISQIVFTPHVQQNGKYQILVYTPGCQVDGSCQRRGEVKVTGTVTKSGAQIPERRFFQSNDFDKYDVVYEGQVDAADGAFRPTVTLAPTTSQNQAVVNIVAQKVQFKLLEEDKTSTASSISPTVTGSSATLNGIYEWKIGADTDITNPDDSTTTSAGLKLKTSAVVHSIIVKDDFIYIGGDFSTQDSKSQGLIILNKDGSFVDVAEGGLNGPIQKMHLSDNLLHVGGSFTKTATGATAGITGFAAYDIKQKAWIALGSGVNGAVREIVEVSLALSTNTTKGVAISGDFTRLGTDSSAIDAAGFAVWIPTLKKWLSSMDGELAIAGVLTSSVLSGNNTVYSGSISSNSMLSSGAVYLAHGKDKTKIQTSKLRFTSSAQNSLQKRDVIDMGISGVKAGQFYVNKDAKANLTILGGSFSALGSKGTIKNLAVIDGNSGEITGGSGEFDADSTIMTMANVDLQLFLGGSLEGANNEGISGIAMWDLGEKKLAASQPPGLKGGNNVTVYSITNRPSTTDVYVAGDFDTAGALSCPNLCVYGSEAKQWRQAGSETPGVIYTTQWVGANSLLVGGDMKFNNTKSYLALFDAQSSRYLAIDGDVSKIPGPVTSIARDSDNGDSMFLTGYNPDGSSYLVKFQDKTVVDIENKFEKPTKIQGIQVLQMTSSVDDAKFLDGKHALVVTGALKLQGFGNASVVTYDGSQWKPFLLTSRADGEPGAVSSFFSEYPPTFSPEGKKMKRAYVILISLAIALLLTFLLVVAGVAASYLRRRSEGYVPAPTMGATEKSVVMQDRLPPQDLFHHGVGPDARHDRAPMI